VVLDVGTNNQQLLNDPLYMGWRHPRITDDEYYQFVDDFIQAVKHRWPDVLLQFEDFAQKNAMPLLNRYRDEICSFNDDIQGTAAVTVGTLIAASRAAGSQLSYQKIVFLGAGSAGCGIAEQIIAQTQREGLSEELARSRVFMVDRFGLLTDAMPNLLPFQTKLVQKRDNLKNWDTDNEVLSLLDVVRNMKPDILIGVSGQTGLFTEEIIREMHKHCERPIVMPLSNPTSRVEATRRTSSPGPKAMRWLPPAARLIRWCGRIKPTQSPSATTPTSSRALVWGLLLPVHRALPTKC
jgi:malate dehydrogenase (oxaloacetate-decarboxylating)